MSTSPESKPSHPILLAEMQVHFKIDGSLTSAPAKIIQRLWPRPFVTIEVSNVARNPQPFAQSSSDPPQKGVLTFPITEGPSVVQLESGVCVEVVPTSWLPFQKEAELRLQKSPSVVLDSGKPITRLQFDVLNITGDLFHLPLALQAQSWLVRIDPAPNYIELEEALKTDGGYAVTHRGIVHRTDGEGFPKDDAHIFLRGLEHFLSFVCGSQSSASNVVGFDSEENEAWKQWGSYHVSQWKRRRSWSDVTIRGVLPEIFERFWLEYRKSSEHLDRVLGWYIYNNESGALDLSIVLNQTILEILTTLMPSGKEGGPRGERIAKMLQKQGIDPQIPAHCSVLAAMAKKYNFAHGPHALVKIRNSIVHAKVTVDIPSIDAYREAKQLGLWYVELLLLRMFEYEGEYASRLVEVQRPGATEPVPWAKDSVS